MIATGKHTIHSTLHTTITFSGHTSSFLLDYTLDACLFIQDDLV